MEASQALIVKAMKSHRLLGKNGLCGLYILHVTSFAIKNEINETTCTANVQNLEFWQVLLRNRFISTTLDKRSLPHLNSFYVVLSLF